MHSHAPPLWHRTAHLFLRFLALLAPLLASGQAAREYQLRDQGRVRPFEVAADEILFSRPGGGSGEIATAVRANVAGAKIVADFGAKALVKLPQAMDQQKAALGAKGTIGVAGFDLQPVLYEKGV